MHLRFKTILYSIFGIILGFLIISKTSAATFLSQEDSNASINIFQNQIINDTLFAAGNEVTIDGIVKGDVVSGATKITVNGTIEGNLIAGASDIIINGTVERNVYSGSQNLTINGSVNKEVFAGASNVTITDSAMIKDGLYLGASKVNISELANVTNNRHIDTFSSKVEKPIKNIINNAIMSILGLIFTGIILLRLFPKIMETTTKNASEKWGISFLYGAVALIIVPIISIILISTRIGMPVGFALLGLYILEIYLTAIFIGFSLGQKLLKDKSTIMQMIIGIILISLLRLIPSLGPIIVFLTITIGLGAKTLTLKEYFKKN